MIKSGAAAAVAAPGGKNESSSSSIRSERGGGKGRSAEGSRERRNVEKLESSSQASSERRVETQMSISEKSLRSSGSDIMNTVTKVGRPPKNPGLFPAMDIEHMATTEVEVTEVFNEGSKYRKGSKRSRTGNDDLLSDIDEGEKEKRYEIEELLQQLDNQIEEVYKKGERGRTNYNKLVTLSIFRRINPEIIRKEAEVSKLKDRIMDVQDEKVALQKQIIELQSANLNIGKSVETERTYLDAVMKNKTNEIIEGRQLPITVIPGVIRHAPAEKILIYKAEVKGGMAYRAKQEEFRCDLKVTLGDELMEEVSAVRPTRFGGHTIIFSSEEGREKASNVIKNNKAVRGIEERNSCIIALKKKKSKFVCREIPNDTAPEEVLKEMYEKHNPQLQKIPEGQREAKIFITRLGWIFEVSVSEAIAFYSQNGRIRFGMGRELKTEEFIPLQQCYKCCNFGHNAYECRSEMEWCRLCGRKGHSGKVCPVKDDKEKWRCANCILKNENKGLKLDIKHGAAQLHKCAVAAQQKEIRKTQLAVAGVITSAIDLKKRGMDNNKRGEGYGKSTSEGIRGESGANERRRTRSKSRRQMGLSQNTVQSSIAASSTTSSASSARQLFNTAIFSNQSRRVIHTIPSQNLQRTGRYSEGSLRGRGMEHQIGGNNFVSEHSGNNDIVMERPRQNIMYYRH